MAEAGGGRVLVLGVGNADRGDDAAGRAVARAVRGALPAAVEVAEADGEATNILAKLEGASAAYVVDACASGAAAGAVHRFDVGRAPLPLGAFGASTHGFGLHEAIELARVLGQLPVRCVVYAIEGTGFETGAPLSATARAGVAEVVRRLTAELEREFRKEGTRA